MINVHTFIAIDITEEFHEKIRGATRYVYQGTLLPQPKTRRDREALFFVRVVLR